MQKHNILIVDDEKNILKIASMTLKQSGYEVDTAMSSEEAIEKFNHNSFHLIISDLKLPGISGIGLLEYIKSREPDIPVIVITAFGTIENAVEAMKKGAFNYLAKPVNPDELLSLVKEALEKYELRRENITLKSELRQKYSFSNIIGKSPAMQELFDTIVMISKTQSNILIMGESGTGKELVARALHYDSDRAEKPFVTIDCAAIPGEIMESELFGHEKGAFTGAHERKTGLLEHADKGTVFLDEIGELDLNLQKKLLRFLQEKEILKVGGVNRIKLDARIIAATNKELEKEVKARKFREDLFYRLNVVTLKVPPLRERKDDIPLLANHFLEKLNKIEGKMIKGFEDDVMDALIRHDWPGNVRELENVVERAYVLCPNVTINIKYLHPKLINLVQEEREEINRMNLIETEKKLIIKALNNTSWNQSKAAEILGISRKQLRTKMKRHSLLPS
ncbi:transcriptional regulatory protein ZraR [bacterium BMS3Abin07]|nr:transcriptional regulatory protein ZraR [bacterium BMS3Abin07]GBE32730.1 transcriptional regulatory protein ZraR [bacterium BMS3Bbin05]HDL20272.1 sigma-54-dependent Fis family transcriptional regulator [Nitrospirota bacterium]HDO21343.1 sigma-54-dependent Fis family transcriptional regulator [Nitrospirota bacterium]HDZ87787.1 sigma-54-dependent Fis family transcriptional regulator [Nitrospirota bacterium]